MSRHPSLLSCILTPVSCLLTRRLVLTAVLLLPALLALSPDSCLLSPAVLAQPRYKIIDFSKLNDAVTQVNRIVRDSQGMMWFGTSEGLYRYDGYEFRSFKSRSGDGVNMQSNNIVYLYAGSEGSLWCVVSKRAFLFDTHLEGNSNAGHDFAREYDESQRLALLEYLKTL